MNALIFDTLKFSQKLKSAGFTDKQAEGASHALAETFTDSVASKADIQASEAALRGEIRDVETALNGKIDSVEAAFRSEIQQVRTELKADILLIKWMGGIIIAATVIPLIRDLL